MSLVIGGTIPHAAGDAVAIERGVPLWNRFRPPEWPEAPERVQVFDGSWLVTVQSAASGGTRNMDPELRAVCDARFGFPFKTMKFEFWGSITDGGHYVHVLPAKGVIQPFLRDPGRLVPTRVLPLGFAVSTTFYALLLGVGYVAVSAYFRLVNRVIRRRQGLCPTCAYPIGAGARCSECGAVTGGGG
ncbi:MAG: hypothetical protein HKO59_05125 [Phycisphaerales bacterium]|nr:hypothetical protein [Phycisphaerales bacterium]